MTTSTTAEDDVFMTNVRIAYQMLVAFDDIRGGSLNDPNTEYVYHEWASLPEEEKLCFTEWFQCATMAPTAFVLFNQWVVKLYEQGWTAGPQYNPAKKESPLFVGWEELPALQRERLSHFYNVVRTLTMFSPRGSL
jgi:hypothetical protein